MANPWRTGVLALAACVAAPAFCAGPPLIPGSVTTQDGQRNYLLFDPGPSSSPRPLVILLHGHMGSMEHTMGEKTASPLSAWLPIAAREGLLVAGLDGLRGADHKQGWNDCRPDASENPKCDDVAFVAAVVQKLVRESHADPGRIYIMGMSNGAMMTLRLGLQLQPAPAAIAAVCGSMTLDGGPCGGAAKRPVSALIIAGTEDPLVPYGGGQVHFGKKLRGGVVSMQDTVNYWLAADGLSGTQAAVTAFPHLHSERQDPTHATRYLYGAAGGPQVEFIRVDGGGHNEPSIAHDYGAVYHLVAGRQNQDFESAEEAWRFFKDKRAK